MIDQNSQERFNEYHYTTHYTRPYRRDTYWMAFFGQIADQILVNIKPKRVLDAGCALGLLVEQLRLRQIEADGIDISEYAISQAPETVRPFLRVGSISAAFGQHYDLIICNEVVEYMSQAEAEQTIVNLCMHSDDILFSSVPLDFKSDTRCNVHPIEYWAELFARQGFVRDVDFDVSFLSPWTIRFRRSSEPIHRLLRDYERRFWELWKANTDLRELVLEQRTHERETEQEKERVHQQAEVLALQQQLIAITARLDYQSLCDSAEAHGLRKTADTPPNPNLYIHHLEKELRNRDQYIGWLENIIRAFEQGLFMSVQRELRHSPPILPPPPGTPPPQPLLVRAVRRLADELLKMPGMRRSMPGMPLTAAALPVHTDPYLRWIADYEPTAEDLAQQRQQAQHLAQRPLISIITPVFNPPPATLQAMIDSVRQQTYDHWEVCFADASNQPEIAPILAQASATDPRIRVQYLSANGGISANSNAALAMAQGEFVLLADHDDTLAPHALFALAECIAAQPDVDVIYFDEDKITEDGTQRHSPWFKPPGRSPDLMLATNYLMHGLFRRDLVETVGRFDPATDGAQDWDLALRCFDQTQRIAHIPQILYHWRQVPGSAAREANAKPWALAGQERALRSHLDRIGASNAQVHRLSPSDLHVVWPTAGRLVSIIIPTRDKPDLIRACVQSILTQTAYPHYEIVLVDTGSTDAQTLAFYAELRTNPRITFVTYSGEFNYSRANNLGVAHAKGDLLLFLNNDTEVRSANWLDELVGWIERPEVGVVGCKLVRPDGTTQHAGIAIGLGGHGSHLFDGVATPLYGPFGSSEWYRDLLAVTGACLMTRRGVFVAVGGFDDRYRIGFSDITFCLYAYARGLRVVYTPWTTLLHHEGASRGLDVPVADVIRATVELLPWIAQGDPYVNPNLSGVERIPAVAGRNEESWAERLARILVAFHLAEASAPRWVETAAHHLRDAPFRHKREVSHPPHMLLCSHEFSQSGAPLILFQLARQMQARGYQVTIAAPHDGPLAAAIQAAGIGVRVVEGLYDNALRAAMVVRDYDMVWVNTILGWRVVIAAYATEVPCAWWIHESGFGRDLVDAEPTIRQAFALADEIVFPVSATAQRYADIARMKPPVCIPHGVFAPEIQSQRQLSYPGRVSLVVLASIEYRKGQHVLLDALAYLPPAMRDQLDVYLVGTVLDASYYYTLRCHPSAKRNVYFTGQLDHQQALAYLACADIFAISSYDEVLPISLLESMALSKAILATNVGGVSEVVRHEQEGLLAPAGDAQALAQHLATLIESPTLRTHLGAAAYTRYEEAFTAEIFATTMEAVATRLISTLEDDDAPCLDHQ
ncbi:glycosyltransferase [Candidatus Oscillochloris fontis]|uniref:glycosyltransferase n=1 Tax=Candidatus Oscillochloris fontis TaxID=2496868 RepID=UPI00101D3FAE|nr:glycosyltransferase [Candidatus Oscillochloris fontis]